MGEEKQEEGGGGAGNATDLIRYFVASSRRAMKRRTRSVIWLRRFLEKYYDAASKDHGKT